MEKIDEIKSLILESKNTVFLGGAGVSTESGIPDFRGPNGLYTQKNKRGYTPEYMLSHTCLVKNPDLFFENYKTNVLHPNAEPNMAHKALATMEEKGLLTAVITQNIDGLHQMAGSKSVIELHGSTCENYCCRCGKQYDIDFILKTDGVPHCSCGGIVRPNVTLYEEELNESALMVAATLMSTADILIVGGTSLTVNPAASLVSLFPGKHLIIINLSETPFDHMAEFVIREKISDVLPLFII